MSEIAPLVKHFGALTQSQQHNADVREEFAVFQDSNAGHFQCSYQKLDQVLVLLQTKSNVRAKRALADGVEFSSILPSSKMPTTAFQNTFLSMCHQKDAVDKIPTIQ